jgi:O-antigen ligase
MNPAIQTRRAPLGSPAVPAALPRAPLDPASPAATGLGFWLFVIVNFMLYVRPTEYLDDVVGQRIFLVLIVACLLVSFPAVLVQFELRRGNNPILALALLLWPFVVVSNLVQSPPRTFEAVDGFMEYGKILVYFLLLLGLVTTTARLRSLLFWLPWFTAIITVIAILQYHGVIQLELFKQLQESNVLRLRATGLFRDPNDLGVLLAVAVVCCLHFVVHPRIGARSVVWVALVGLFLYALYLTHSRGAMLALGAGLFILVRARLGTFAAVVLFALTLPSLVAFSGREVDLGTQHDTATTRMELWNDALVAFNNSPGLGVGQDNLKDVIYQVAHNSYLHAFAELGFFGGCIFLGLFVWPLWTLIALPAGKRVIVNPELRALHPTVTGVLAAYMAGMGSLSLCYLMPTFMMVGLAAVYLRMATTRPAYPPTRLGLYFFAWLALLGVLFWCAMKVVLVVVPRG